MDRRRLVMWLGIVGLLGAACGGGTVATSPTPAAATSAAASVAPTTKPGELDADTIAKAKTEGEVVLYTSLSSSDSKKIADAFAKSEKSYGIKITVNRKSSEDLVTQFMTEVKAGKILADVLETGGLDLAQPLKAGYLEAWKVPAAAGYPAELKDAGGLWHAARLGVETIAFNTTAVPAADAPKTWEDAADPKWKGKCLIESGDVEVLLGLGERKYKGDMAKVQDVLTRTMANCTPAKGHTETVDQLIAGQGAIFWGAHAHSTEQKRAAGAPVDYMQTEGVVTIDGPGLVKGAKHPNAGKVFLNWYLGDEGQKALSDLFRVPAKPGAANARLLPKTIYYTGPTLADKFSAYQDMWNKIVLKK
ncbi:MAG TPA: extracellular solute-binding protein [Candidatus Limnocylindria bacterium]|nr:extracellular solute-binding protein [Candidatus Limnocylindria bacterium]